MDLNEIIQALGGLPEADRELAVSAALEETKHLAFIPQPGPQTEAYFSEADVLLFGGSPGGGKLLDEDTYVPVPLSTDARGWKRHGDIRAGDLVFSPTGQEVRVLARHDTVREPDAYEVELDTGEVFLADAQHYWYTWTRKDRERARKTSREWRDERKAKRKSRAVADSKKPGVSLDVTARNRAREYDIPAPCGSARTTREIADTLTVESDNRLNHSIAVTLPVQAPPAQLPVDPYLLGIWLGDGYTAKPCVIMLTSDWAEIAPYVPAPRRVEVEGVGHRDRKQEVEIRYFSELKPFVKQPGGKRIPAEYLRASYHQRLELLRGMCDTDGTCDARGQVELGFSNKELAHDAHELINSLGVKTSIHRKVMRSDKHAGHWRMKFTAPETVFKLPRKAGRQRPPERPTTRHRYVVRVEKAAPKPMNCLTVEGRLYLIGRSFVTTHNTALEIGLALNEHHRAMVVRKNFVDLTGCLHTLDNILGTANSATGGNRPVYRKPNGGVIEFVGLGDNIDAKQGNPHDLLCVGRGTSVLMGDGTYKAVQDVRVGDLVATLEGPRAVENTFGPMYKEAVRITTSGADQVQSASHEVLTPFGWLSACAFPPCGIYEPTVSRVARIFSEPFYRTRRGLSRLLAHLRGGPRQSPAVPKAVPRTVEKGPSACGVCTGPQVQGSGCAACGGSTLLAPRQVLSSVSMPAQRLPLRGWAALPGILRRFFSACGVGDALKTSSHPGCPVSCSAGSRPCGGHTPESTGLGAAQAGGQVYLHQPGGVGLPSPSCSLAGAPAETRECTGHTPGYDHPYTKDKRRASEYVLQASAWSSPVGVQELFDLQVNEVNHYITAGGFINRNCIDEAAQLPEDMVRMLMGWLRTDRPGQRCRVVMGSNPPLDSTGDWLIEYFGPWLDPQHHNPAEEGELRYFQPKDDGQGYRECGKDDFIEINGVRVAPQSRTFISSKFTDNAFYDAEQYAKSLAGLPDSVRERLTTGNFLLDRTDNIWQLIPTQWVKEAQARWKPQPPTGVPMCAIGVDVAQGGSDNTVVAPRHDAWFAKLAVVPGKETPDGKSAAGVVVKHRRDNAPVIVDLGGGWGGDCYGHLKENGVDATGYLGVKATTGRSADGKLGFTNVRTKAYWRFREALDPSQPGGSPVALPPDSVLLADLCAPTYRVTPNGIEAESKKDVVKRLGRSTDRGDAVVMCWSIGVKAANIRGGFAQYGRNKQPQVVLGHRARRK